jgi:hypothetical protein
MSRTTGQTTGTLFSLEKVPRVDALSRSEFDELRTSRGAYLAYDRLASLDNDSRWEAAHLAVRARGRIICFLPCYRPRRGAWANPAYDLRRILGSDEPAGLESDWSYVGGRADFAAGVLRNPEVGAGAIARAAALLGQALQDAEGEAGRRLCALYVLESDRAVMDILLEGFSAIPLEEFAHLAVTRAAASYPSGLKASHRSVVRRDWLARDRLGLLTECAPWDSITDDVVELISNVRRSNALPDDERLVRFRLEEWLSVRSIDRFIIRVLRAGTSVAVSLGWIAGDLMQIHEVGLVDDRGDCRRVAYVEAMIYAPLRLASARGCASLTLGAKAIHTKRLRGATVDPLVGFFPGSVSLVSVPSSTGGHNGTDAAK